METINVRDRVWSTVNDIIDTHLKAKRSELSPLPWFYPWEELCSDMHKLIQAEIPEEWSVLCVSSTLKYISYSSQVIAGVQAIIQVENERPILCSGFLMGIERGGDHREFTLIEERAAEIADQVIARAGNMNTLTFEEFSGIVSEIAGSMHISSSHVHGLDGYFGFTIGSTPRRLTVESYRDLPHTEECSYDFRFLLGVED